MNPGAARSILIVDDDEVFRKRLVHGFATRGFDARGAKDGEEALALAQEESPELLLLDLKMPGASGLELISGLKAIDPTTNIVVLTGYGSIATALEAVRLGATHYLTKPADIDDILAAFERADGTGKESGRHEHQVPSLARAEWEHIQRVLVDVGGNITQAAKLLGVHRRSLQRKLAKFPQPR